MTSFAAIFRKELLEIVRSKKLLILCVLFLFFGLSSPILAKILPGLLKTIPGTGIQLIIPDATYKDAIDQLVKNVSQLGLLGIIFVFAGSIAEEKNKRTFELILSKPVARNQIILAKFLSATTALLAAFLIASVFFYIYTTTIFTSFSLTNFVILDLLLFELMLLVASFTLLSSTLASTTITAASIAFGGEIALTVLASLFDKISKYSPGFLLSNYKELVENGWSNIFLPFAFTSAVLILIFFLLAVLTFQKQEIER